MKHAHPLSRQASAAFSPLFALDAVEFGLLRAAARADQDIGLERGSRGVQAKRPASRDGAHGDSVADGRTLKLRERILAIGVEVESELFLVVIFLRDQRAASHERSPATAVPWVGGLAA